MSCTTLDGSWLSNADLFDDYTNNDQLISDLLDYSSSSSTSSASCPYSTAALITFASLTLFIHACVAAWTAYLLLRVQASRYACLAYSFSLFSRFSSGTSSASSSASSPAVANEAPLEREATARSIKHRQSIAKPRTNLLIRYTLSALSMSVCIIIFCIVRLVSLTKNSSSSSDVSSYATASDYLKTTALLLRSFSPRVGANQGLNFILYLSAVCFIDCVGMSVTNAVKAAITTASKAEEPKLFGYLPTNKFYLFARVLVIFQAVIWSLVFVLPTAASSSSSTSAQQAIIAILMTAGTFSYYMMAISAKEAARSLSATLKVQPATLAVAKALEKQESAPSMKVKSNSVVSEVSKTKPPSVTIHVVEKTDSNANSNSTLTSVTAANAVQPTVSVTIPTGHHNRSGLNAKQLANRENGSQRFAVANVVVLTMLCIHFVLTCIFVILLFAIPNVRIGVYWLYCTLIYWALVVLFRLWLFGQSK